MGKKRQDTPEPKPQIPIWVEIIVRLLGAFQPFFTESVKSVPLWGCTRNVCIVLIALVVAPLVTQNLNSAHNSAALSTSMSETAIAMIPIPVATQTLPSSETATPSPKYDSKIVPTEAATHMSTQDFQITPYYPEIRPGDIVIYASVVPLILASDLETQTAIAWTSLPTFTPVR